MNICLLNKHTSTIIAEKNWQFLMIVEKFILIFILLLAATIEVYHVSETL